MKLESKHLAPYLPYGLKGQVDNYEIVKLIGIHHFNLNYGKPFNVIDGLENWSTTNFKPILKPLPFKDFASRDYTYNELEFFLKNHYDIFGLIEKDLAIDINTLE